MQELRKSQNQDLRAAQTVLVPIPYISGAAYGRLIGNGEEIFTKYAKTMYAYAMKAEK